MKKRLITIITTFIICFAATQANHKEISNANQALPNTFIAKNTSYEENKPQAKTETLLFSEKKDENYLLKMWLEADSHTKEKKESIDEPNKEENKNNPNQETNIEKAQPTKKEEKQVEETKPEPTPLPQPETKQEEQAPKPVQVVNPYEDMPNFSVKYNNIVYPTRRGDQPELDAYGHEWINVSTTGYANSGSAYRPAGSTTNNMLLAAHYGGVGQSIFNINQVYYKDEEGNCETLYLYNVSDPVNNDMQVIEGMVIDSLRLGILGPFLIFNTCTGVGTGYSRYYFFAPKDYNGPAYYDLTQYLY